MKKEYIVATKAGEMYLSFYRIPLPFYCFGRSNISVRSAVKYSNARKFRSLYWATYRARFLSNHSRDYYYVFTATAHKNRQNLLKIVDETINDKLIESRRQCDIQIKKLIDDWKAENGLN